MSEKRGMSEGDCRFFLAMFAITLFSIFSVGKNLRDRLECIEKAVTTKPAPHAIEENEK